jgi:uncharacterized protein YihD (DUF1040 family)
MDANRLMDESRQRQKQAIEAFERHEGGMDEQLIKFLGAIHHEAGYQEALHQITRNNEKGF